MIKKFDEFILKEKINLDDIDSNEMFDNVHQINLPTNIKNNITKEFSKLGDYFDDLSSATTKIWDILSNYNVVVLQEDFTPFSGFFTGKTGNSSLFLGYNGKVVKNSKLILSWYKLQSKIEVIKYIS